MSSLSTTGMTLAYREASLTNTVCVRSVGFSMLVVLERDLVVPSEGSALPPSLKAVGPYTFGQATPQTHPVCFAEHITSSKFVHSEHPSI